MICNHTDKRKPHLWKKWTILLSKDNKTKLSNKRVVKWFLEDNYSNILKIMDSILKIIHTNNTQMINYWCFSFREPSHRDHVQWGLNSIAFDFLFQWFFEAGNLFNSSPTMPILIIWILWRCKKHRERETTY